MSTADIQLSVVFGGQYSFEKLQSDWEQDNPLERDFIKNKPDLVNFDAETVTVETVIFEENPTGTIAPLKLQYNQAEKTIEFGLKDGGVLQLGKEMFEEYTNIDTVALTNGMIVSTAAISGNRKGIKRTDFTSLTSIRSIVGMVTVASIGTNQSGRVTTKGVINDLNTNGIGEGSQLWGNPSVLGGWSGSKPAKPQYAVQIGQVVVASATVGSVELNIAKDVKFSDLADVNGTTNLIDNADTIPKRDADGIIREISIADIKADFKADTDLIYEPLLGFTPENVAKKGQANGYASLGADGLVPSNQLPSFVDDVLEFANLAAFPAVGEQGKIYVALDTNKTYRWSGSTYIYITSGAVDSVAGKTGVVTLVKGDVGLGNVDNTSDVNKPVSTAQQNALDLKIDKTLSSEITTVGDSETMAVKASDSIWKRITWSNIKATLKTYFETLFVTLTGAQNIAGVKTFTDSPVVPTPVNNTDAANKAFVQSIITVGNDTYQENKLITDARVATLENTINSANINQETTATVTGVDTVALPKTAANTGMHVQLFGQSAQNLVNGANIAPASSVTFPTILNNKYYVSNQVALVTGDGNNYTSTNSGATAINIVVVNLTATFGAGAELTFSQAQSLFANYFEGSDNVLGTGRVRSVGKNLFDYNDKDVIDGYLIAANGTLSANANAYLTGFIKVKPNTAYIFNRNATSYFNFYDNNKQYISTSSLTMSSVTTPANCSYIRTYSSYATKDKTALQIEIGTVSTTYEPFRQSSLYLTTPELRSNGLVKDEIRKGTNGYELIKRVGVGTLGSELVTNGGFETDLTGWTSNATITRNTTTPIIGSADLKLVTTSQFLGFRNITAYNFTAGKIYRVVFYYRAAAGVLNLKITQNTSIGSSAVAGSAQQTYSATSNTLVVYDFLCTSSSVGYLQFTQGTATAGEYYVDGVSIKESSNSDGLPLNSAITILGSNVHYTLATPTITPIAHAGLLNSNANGTAYFEPIIADAGVYGSNLAVQLTDYPIASFESIRKYANGTYTELNTATAVIASGGLSFTHPDLAAGDLVMFTYAYNRESIGRSMTLTHYDSRFVIADTANSKVYRWRITSTNGVASIALTEV